jgi:ABC-type bacteriocin/lantibiotic exporter with double-glycine peptidase domain
MTIFAPTVRFVPARTEHDPAKVQGTLRYISITLREIPGIYHGLKTLTYGYRWQLRGLAAFNLAIALWGFVQPFISAWATDAFVAHEPYLDTLIIVIYSFLLVKLPNGFILPLARDAYAWRYVRWHFEKDISIRCFEVQQSLHGAGARIENKTPVLQEGRPVVYEMVEFFTREPLQALRGLLTTFYLLYFSWGLMLVVMGGVVADFFITTKMRRRIDLPKSHMQECDFRVNSLEYELFRPGGWTTAKRQTYVAEWEKKITASVKAGLLGMFYQVVWRGGMSLLVQIAVMTLVAWWTYTGRISVGEYMVYVGLAAAANDPFEIILNFVARFADKREKLRQFGLLCNVDFGLAPPHRARN